jgi:Skp family chaperone for outer membrane proteins
MSQKTTPDPQPNQQDKITRWVTTRIQLVLRLMFDGRVKPLFKLFPILGVLLLFTPFLGGFLARIGAFLVAMVLFVEASPPKVVREQLDDLYQPIGEKKNNKTTEVDEIIDAVFREIDEEDKTHKKQP